MTVLEDIKIVQKLAHLLEGCQHRHSLGFFANRLDLSLDKLRSSVNRVQDAFDVPILIVAGDGVELSRRGVELARRFAIMFASVQEGPRPREQIELALEPMIQEAILPVLCQDFLPKWAGQYRLKFTRIDYQALQNNRNVSTRLAFGWNPQQKFEYPNYRLLGPEVPTYLLVPEGHRLNGANSVSQKELSEDDVVFYEANDGELFLHKLLDKYPPAKWISCHDSQTVQQAVASGAGVGIAPLMPRVIAGVNRYPSGIRFCDLGQRRITAYMPPNGMEERPKAVRELFGLMCGQIEKVFREEPQLAPAAGEGAANGSIAPDAPRDDDNVIVS